jgi:hypothetical protein
MFPPVENQVIFLSKSDNQIITGSILFKETRLGDIRDVTPEGIMDPVVSVSPSTVSWTQLSVLIRQQYHQPSCQC